MQEKLINYIKTELVGDPELELKADDDLLNLGLLTSMDFMRLIAFMQREFGVTMGPQDMRIEHFTSVQTLSKYVQQQLDGHGKVENR